MNLDRYIMISILTLNDYSFVKVLQNTHRTQLNDLYGYVWPHSTLFMHSCMMTEYITPI